MLQKLTFFMNKVPFKGYGQVALTLFFTGRLPLPLVFNGQDALIPFLLRAGCPYSFHYFTGRVPLPLVFYGQVALTPCFYGQVARTPFLFLRAGCPYSFYYITGRMPVLLFSWL